jgi:hypothetical protein
MRRLFAPPRSMINPVQQAAMAELALYPRFRQTTSLLDGPGTGPKKIPVVSRTETERRDR